MKPSVPEDLNTSQSAPTSTAQPVTTNPHPTTTILSTISTSASHPTSMGYKSSMGHTIAYQAMEDTLPNHSAPESTNTTTTPGARFGINYKPNKNSLYTARPYGSTYSTAQAFKPSLMGQSTPTNSILQDSTVSSTGGVFPKTSTPISSAAQSPATSCAELTAISNVNDTQEIFITGAPHVKSINTYTPSTPSRPPPRTTPLDSRQASPASSQHSQQDSIGSSGSIPARGYDQVDRSIPPSHTAIKPPATTPGLSKPRYASKNDIANTYTRQMDQVMLLNSI